MHAASFSGWAAAFCAALSLGAITAIPFLLWVDADYWLVEDWEPVRDRVLVEVTNARHMACEARQKVAVTAAALLLLLAAPHSPEASR